MHCNFAALLSVTALAFLSLSSSSTVLASQNTTYPERDLLAYSRAAAQSYKDAQMALSVKSSSTGLLEVDPALHVLKRRCKSKKSKSKSKTKGKKHHHHKSHSHTKQHHKHHTKTTEDSEKCDVEDTSTTTDAKVNTATAKSEKASTAKTTTNTTKTKTNNALKANTVDTTVTSSSGSGSYKRVQQNRGSNFWSGGNWDFFTYADPTHGQVQFKSESSAKSQGLIGMKNGAAFMRASNKDIGWGANRPSVRFTSKKAYDSGLIIFDVAKMPVGCGTWPALWTTKGDTWPHNGEIDVMEGVGYTAGGKNANQMTVHLGKDSPLSLKRRGVEKRASYTGKLMKGATNCNQWGGGSNTGCAFFDSNAQGPSWGEDFNAAGGGVWAMQFGNNQGVKIWFWGRKSGSLPDELSKANVSPEKLDPSSWGKPMANFQSNIIDEMVKGQNIIMDITIGGDWAGNVAMDGQCAGKNMQQAITKGSNYDDAEFILNAIDVYCQNGKC